MDEQIEQLAERVAAAGLATKYQALNVLARGMDSSQVRGWMEYLDRKAAQPVVEQAQAVVEQQATGSVYRQRREEQRRLERKMRWESRPNRPQFFEAGGLLWEDE